MCQSWELFKVIPLFCTFQQDQYTDERQNWEQNEVGCDYNAALMGNLARMVMSQAGQLKHQQPTQ